MVAGGHQLRKARNPRPPLSVEKLFYLFLMFPPTNSACKACKSRGLLIKSVHVSGILLMLLVLHQTLAHSHYLM